MQLPFLCSIPASFPAFSSSKPYFCCRRFLKFSSYRKMNRNRNRGGYSRGRASPFTGESSRRDECDDNFQHLECHSQGDSANKSKWPSLSCSSVNDRSLHERGRQHLETPRERSPVVDSVSLQDESPPFPHSAKDRMYKQPITERCGKAQTSPVNSVVNGSSGYSGFSLLERFDICQSKKGTAIKLKAPLHIKNREKRREGAGQLKLILRPGMVLLKNFISHNDQINIVKRCRDLGVGTGGFYQPAYHDGSRMHLQMMCLGKNWDPETRLYGNQRSIDGAEPPSIPEEFKRLVEKAIQACHAVIKQESKVKNVEEVLPGMNPDVCIVNFYSGTGRLGLHQDRDESGESLRNGLPVVSFSIGDAAEFLYGDGRDTEKADKIKLESGDVLVFGGQARHVFHGVQSILTDSAPKMMVEEAELRPGRLNLTFRRY